MKDIKATHIILGGMVFPWAAKAPYVSSGHSVLGGLEFNQTHDVVKCHKCGCWFKSLGLHSRDSEGVPARQYRRDHGLRGTTSLNVPSLNATWKAHGKRHHPTADVARTRLIQARKVLARNPPVSLPGCMEERNLKMTCTAQLPQRIMQTAYRVDGTPFISDLADDGLDHTVISLVMGMSMSKVFRFLGLAPNIHRKRGIREPLSTSVRQQRTQFAAESA